MQPYIFPYIGYFQLMKEVDTMIFLDDVNFINKGWINRNRILVNGKDFLFTLDLKGASQNKKINEIDLGIDEKWKKKFLRTIEEAYKKAPCYESARMIIEQVFSTTETNLSRFIFQSFSLINGYLGINTRLVASSSVYGGNELKGQERIRFICEAEKATEYINPPGGQELYDNDFFTQKQIELSFLQPSITAYPQFSNEFVPGLSIIDVMMFNSKEVILNNLLKAGRK